MNLESKLGHTALTWAATCGHVAVARVLLQAGGDIDIATSTEVRRERERGWELGERESRRKHHLCMCVH